MPHIPPGIITTNSGLQIEKSLQIAIESARSAKSAALIIVGYNFVEMKLRSEWQQQSACSFAQILLKVLLQDMNRHDGSSFELIIIIVDDQEAQTLYDLTFKSWIDKNSQEDDRELSAVRITRDARAVPVPSTTDSSLASAGIDVMSISSIPEPSTSLSHKRLVEWLRPQPREENLAVVLYEEAYNTIDWIHATEVLMVEPDSLSQGVLKHIEKELRNLYGWQKTWDGCSYTDKVERANKGQCRVVTGRSCHPWKYDGENATYVFLDETEQDSAFFFNAILWWTSEVGLESDYWNLARPSQRSTILKAIKDLWKKPRCRLGLCFEYQREPDTFYIPISTCLKYAQKLALVHWSEMMRRNPDYFVHRVPDYVHVALNNFAQGIPSPWKTNMPLNIKDKARSLQIEWEEPTQQIVTEEIVEEEGVQRETTWSWQTQDQSWESQSQHPQWQDWQESSAASSSWSGWRSYPS